MSTENPGQFNLLYNVLFMGVIALVLYLIPAPTDRGGMIVFELSRNPKKAEIHQAAAETNDEPFAATESEEEEHQSTEPDPIISQAPVVEEREHAEELIEEGKSTRRIVSDGFGTSSFSSVEANDELTDVEYFREYSRIYKEQKLRGVQPESRTDVVIRYYQKKKDGDKIFRVRALGFYIHERPSSEKFDQYTSNAIYYGDQVSLEDIKMVAYTLMRQGVDIKTIEPSQFFSDWKAHSIEIGTDDTMQDAPSLTLGDVRKLRF